MQTEELYNSNKEKYMGELFENQYVFEVTKCCGYFVWTSVFKSFSLQQLYHNIKAQFEITDETELIKLCVVNNMTNEKRIVPNDNTIIKEFIMKNADFFHPVYKYPAKIVYKVHLVYEKCFSENCLIHK